VAVLEPPGAVERRAARLRVRAPRRWTPQPPRSPAAWSIAALVVAAGATAATFATFQSVQATLAAADIQSPLIAFLGWLATIVTASLFVPAARSTLAALRMRQTRTADLATARVSAAAARDQARIALGYAAGVALCLAAALFVTVNDLSVGRTFFNLPLITSTFGLILAAFWVNVQIFCIAEALVLAWGLSIAIARFGHSPAARPVRLIATAYVDLFRGIPAIIAIYLIGFGLPLTGLPPFGWLSPMWLAILALTLTYGAYVSEVYRAGIESVHPSQTAAARSLGLSHAQTLRYVVVPQAVRRIIPPLLNDFISLQKDTALVNVIGTIDSFNQAKMVASNHFNLSSVTTVAFLFFIITIPQARFVDRLMEADQQRMRAG
jgi:polar amino acid transport system permease protein